ELLEGAQLRGAVDDRAEHLTGEPALADLEAVGDHVIDPGARGQRVDHLVEAARDQGGDPPGRTGPRHQLERPVRGHQGLAHLLEHGFLETFEQRDPGPQRPREDELAAKRRRGGPLDPAAHAGSLSACRPPETRAATPPAARARATSSSAPSVGTRASRTCSSTDSSRPSSSATRARSDCAKSSSPRIAAVVISLTRSRTPACSATSSMTSWVRNVESTSE